MISTQEELKHVNNDNQKISSLIAQQNIDYEERHYNITFQVCCTQLIFEVVLYIYLLMIKLVTLNTLAWTKGFESACCYPK